MARYLVTGGAGFIGSHLVDSLIDKGHDVCIIDNLSTGRKENINKHAKFYHEDINNYLILRKVMNKCHGCFHLAAVASVEASVNCWVDTHRTNLTATIAILDVAKDINSECHPFPVVYASSAAVYGANPNCPYKESDETVPISPYGIDKLGCELHAKFAGQCFNLPNVGLRFFNVYGDRQDPDSPYSGVISIFSKRLLKKQPLVVFGDGNQIRDFIYVKDVVNYLESSMQKATAKSSVYNACTGKEVTLNTLVNTLGAVMNEKPEIMYEPARVGDIKISKGVNKLALEELEVAANTPLYDGLDKMLNSN